MFLSEKINYMMNRCPPKHLTFQRKKTKTRPLLFENSDVNFDWFSVGFKCVAPGFTILATVWGYFLFKCSVDRMPTVYFNGK